MGLGERLRIAEITDGLRRFGIPSSLSAQGQIRTRRFDSRRALRDESRPLRLPEEADEGLRVA